MHLFDVLLHIANFALPALALALMLPLLMGRARSPRAWFSQFGIQLACGLVVLLGGLVLTGQDGRMATYAALVLVAGSVQALMRRTGPSRYEDT